MAIQLDDVKIEVEIVTKGGDQDQDDDRLRRRRRGRDDRDDPRDRRGVSRAGAAATGASAGAAAARVAGAAGAVGAAAAAAGAAAGVILFVDRFVKASVLGALDGLKEGVSGSGGEALKSFLSKFGIKFDLAEEIGILVEQAVEPIFAKLEGALTSIDQIVATFTALSGTVDFIRNATLLGRVPGLSDVSDAFSEAQKIDYATIRTQRFGKDIALRELFKNLTSSGVIKLGGLSR